MIYCKKKLKINTTPLIEIKEVMNCILEHGAYSDKNYNQQMVKKSSNYNDFEKLLVTMTYRYKKFEGKKLQQQLFDFLKDNKDYLDYIKTMDTELYDRIMEINNNGRNG